MPQHILQLGGASHTLTPWLRAPTIGVEWSKWYKWFSLRWPPWSLGSLQAAANGCDHELFGDTRCKKCSGDVQVHKWRKNGSSNFHNFGTTRWENLCGGTQVHKWRQNDSSNFYNFGTRWANLCGDTQVDRWSQNGSSNFRNLGGNRWENVCGGTQVDKWRQNGSSIFHNFGDARWRNCSGDVQVHKWRKSDSSNFHNFGTTDDCKMVELVLGNQVQRRHIYPRRYTQRNTTARVVHDATHNATQLPTWRAVDANVQWHGTQTQNGSSNFRNFGGNRWENVCGGTQVDKWWQSGSSNFYNFGGTRWENICGGTQVQRWSQIGSSNCRKWSLLKVAAAEPHILKHRPSQRRFCFEAALRHVHKYTPGAHAPGPSQPQCCNFGDTRWYNNYVTIASFHNFGDPQRRPKATRKGTRT